MKRYKPTTPGRRHYTVEDRQMVTTDEPFKALTKTIKKAKGRTKGLVTVRHKGGGNKRIYRKVIFGEEKKGVKGIVKSIEYDPNRSAFIALVSYQDGDWRYILAPNNLKVGDEVICEENAPLKEGNRLLLKNIPIGTMVHNVEIQPNTSGKLGRAAGTAIQIAGQEGEYTYLKMPSSEIRKVLSSCYASIGQLSNLEHGLVSYGKAGRMRALGIRPTVRGKVMNPREHPYGGGEGRTQRGTKRPKDIYGNVTGGRKTRKKNKYSDKLIVERRKKK
ncbi:MAG: 50S ribosomal protein L2 [Minisyncoccia bacterium]